METKEFIEALNIAIQQTEEAITEFELKKEQIAAAIYEQLEKEGNV